MVEKKNAGSNTLEFFLFPTFIAGLFFIFVLLFFPFRAQIQFDMDEGLNLMRSYLLNRGYFLYSEISSDQPPLFSYILMGIIRLFGTNILIARLSVLLFSSMLVWFGASMLIKDWGKGAAIIFVILLILLPNYLQLSVSIMIGLPAISMAVGSFYFLQQWYYSQSTIPLILSAILMTLSISIKIFTILLAPAIFFVFLINFFRQKKSGINKGILNPVLIWIFVFSASILLIIFLFIGPQNLNYLISPHIKASLLADYGNNMWQMLKTIPIIWVNFILGLTASVFCIHKNRTFWLTFFLWFGVLFIIFIDYKPFWYHYLIYIAMPAVFLASISINEALKYFSRIFFSHSLTLTVFYTLIILLFGFLIVYSAPKVFDELRVPSNNNAIQLDETTNEFGILKDLYIFKDRINWVVTDQPIFAYIINKPVPPILATFSGKMYLTDQITDQTVISAINTNSPEVVLLSQFEYPNIITAIEKKYKLYSKHGNLSLYVQRILIKTK